MWIKWRNSFLIIGTVQFIDNDKPVEVPPGMLDWFMSLPSTFYEVVENATVDTEE